MKVKNLLSVLVIGGVILASLSLGGCSKEEATPDPKAEPEAKPGSLAPPADLPDAMKKGPKGAK